MRHFSFRLRIAVFALSAVITAAAIAAAFVPTGSAGANLSHSFKVTPPFAGPNLEAFTTQTFTVSKPSTVTRVVVSFLFSKDVTVVSAGQRSPGTGTCTPSSGLTRQIDCPVGDSLAPGDSVTYDVFFTGDGTVEVTARFSFREGLGDNRKSPVQDTILSSPGSITFLSSTTNKNGVCARTFPAVLGTDAVASGARRRRFCSPASEP
jgi:hypothetical protein